MTRLLYHEVAAYSVKECVFPCALPNNLNLQHTGFVNALLKGRLYSARAQDGPQEMERN